MRTAKREQFQERVIGQASISLAAVQKGQVSEKFVHYEFLLNLKFFIFFVARADTIGIAVR